MTVPYILMCSELSTSVRRQAGQVPYVEWLGSEAGWWHGWCHLPSPPTLRGTVGTPSRAAFFTPKQSHENERTRYLYITRNPRYFKRLTFPQKSKPISKKLNLLSTKVGYQSLMVASIPTTYLQILFCFLEIKNRYFSWKKKKKSYQFILQSMYQHKNKSILSLHYTCIKYNSIDFVSFYKNIFDN